MSLGEQKANNLESIGKDFEKFLKQLPKTKQKTILRNADLQKSKTDGLKSICLKYGVRFDKVVKIFIVN